MPLAAGQAKQQRKGQATHETVVTLVGVRPLSSTLLLCLWICPFFFAPALAFLSHFRSTQRTEEPHTHPLTHTPLPLPHRTHTSALRIRIAGHCHRCVILRIRCHSHHSSPAFLFLFDVFFFVFPLPALWALPFVFVIFRFFFDCSSSPRPPALNFVLCTLSLGTGACVRRLVGAFIEVVGVAPRRRVPSFERSSASDIGCVSYVASHTHLHVHTRASPFIVAALLSGG